MADSQTVLPAIVRARSTELLRLAYVLTGHRATAERLLQDAILDVRKHHLRMDPRDAEEQVRAAMVRIASHGGRAARRRCAVALARSEGMTEAEVAYLLNCSVGTVAHDVARSGAVRIDVPDDIRPTDEWRAEVTDELGELSAGGLDWRTVAVVLVSIAIVVGFLAAVLDDATSPPKRAPLPYFGNEGILLSLPEGGGPRVDLLDSQGLLRTPSGQLVPVGTFTSVLGRTPDGWVVASDSGELESVSTDGDRLSFDTSGPTTAGLSPDGARLMTPDGVFDSLTGRKLLGPALHEWERFVGWGTAGAVVVTSSGKAHLINDGTAVELDAVPYAVARHSDRVLVHATDECDAVFTLDPTGHMTLVRSWCSAEALSLSPDGSAVLVGDSHRRASGSDAWRARGLLDLRTGTFTILHSLPELVQYGGDDLVGVAWEAPGTVLLAYLVGRSEARHPGFPGQKARIVRCVRGASTCRITPGVHTLPRTAAETMFSES